MKRIPETRIESDNLNGRKKREKEAPILDMEEWRTQNQWKPIRRKHQPAKTKNKNGQELKKWITENERKTL